MDMEKSCASILKLMDKYFDREATDDERRRVEAHLPDCPSCRETLISMERIRDVVKIPVEGAVQKEDFEPVWYKIQRAIRLQERPPFWERVKESIRNAPLLQRRKLIPVSAAVAVILLILGQIFLQKTPSYPDPSIVEYVESNTNNVMIYQQEKPMVTVIWLFEEPEEGASPS
jgi:hypothetical protein